jgi:hypothetical protein
MESFFVIASSVLLIKEKVNIKMFTLKKFADKDNKDEGWNSLSS